MTKLDGRTKEEAAKQIDESLKRLQTDHVDLSSITKSYVLKIRTASLPRAAQWRQYSRRRRREKYGMSVSRATKIRTFHLYMLDVAAEHGFHFDTVQMPLNVMDAHFRSFGKSVVPRAAKEGIGILGMKSMGDGAILKSKVVAPRECLRYALGLPTSVVITGIDNEEVLQQALGVMRGFTPFSQDELSELLQRTASLATEGKFEPFKTSAHFDSTARHPEWLGGQSEDLTNLAGLPN
jgi:predicted aldo/keto reductase-like oxidoreductase